MSAVFMRDIVPLGSPSLVRTRPLQTATLRPRQNTGLRSETSTVPGHSSLQIVLLRPSVLGPICLRKRGLGRPTSTITSTAVTSNRQKLSQHYRRPLLKGTTEQFKSVIDHHMTEK